MAFFGGGGASVANMVGATSSAAGAAGLCPAPAAGEEHLFLRGNGAFSWIYPSSTEANSSTDYFSMIFPAYDNGALNSSNINTSRLYIHPIWISGNKTINRIGFRFTTNATGNVRVGLYEASASLFRPSTLIVESTELSGTTNTNVEFTISPSISVKNKLYWGGIVAASSSAVFVGQYDLFTPSYFGSVWNSGIYAQNTRFYVGHSYGALPSDLSSYSITCERGQNQPLIYLRNV